MNYSCLFTCDFSNFSATLHIFAAAFSENNSRSSWCRLGFAWLSFGELTADEIDEIAEILVERVTASSSTEETECSGLSTDMMNATQAKLAV